MPPKKGALPPLTSDERLVKEKVIASKKPRHLKSSRNAKGEPVFSVVEVAEAAARSSLTAEQAQILEVINQADRKGISRLQISMRIGDINKTVLTKALEVLEKAKLVRQFLGIAAPTTPLYIAFGKDPLEAVAGGVWFDDSKDYDVGLVEGVTQALYYEVYRKTFPKAPREDAPERRIIANPIYPATKLSALHTPSTLLRFLKDKKVSTVDFSIKNVMEVMRGLELEGKVETVRPVGGVEVDEFAAGSEGDSDDEPVAKKRRGGGDDDDSDDDSEADRKRERAREKKKAVERARREAEKEKERKEKARRKKEKEKEKKRKEKEKKRRREKEKEKERKRKEKAKKKRKVVESDSDSDDDSDSDGPLVDITEEGKGADKRKRKYTPSASSSSASSASDSDSDSGSASDSDSDGSTDSDAIDVHAPSHKPKSTAAAALQHAGIQAVGSAGAHNVLDLSDAGVAYRATRRLHVALGQTEGPCGQCPQFNFCEPDGPVNPASCEYWTDWMSGAKGGWSADMRHRIEKVNQKRREERERRTREAAEAEAAAQGVDAAVDGVEAEVYDAGFEADDAGAEAYNGAEYTEHAGGQFDDNGQWDVDPSMAALMDVDA
ncbi:34-kDa subunit of RNA polymerase III (C) [Cryptotrichosporon argae]